MSHTKAPWWVEKDWGFVTVVCESGDICEVTSADDADDGVLIAAAPVLLQALKIAAPWVAKISADGNTLAGRALEIVENAISVAEGQAEANVGRDPQQASPVHVQRPATEQDMKVGVERPQNDTADNLFPSCRACNIDKHCTPLETWRKQLEGRVDVCRRNYSAFRHAERFGLVQEIKKPIVFWFERYNKEPLEFADVLLGKDSSATNRVE